MGVFGVSQAGQPIYSGEEHNLQITESVYGTTAPIVIGTTRVHAKLIFYGGFHDVPAPSSGGKGLFGGKNAQEFEYYADTLMLLAQCGQNAIAQGIRNIWDQNGKLFNQSSSAVYIVPPGGGSYVLPAGQPTAMDHGVYASQNYSVAASDFGSGGTNTLTGANQIPFTRVASSPGANQYTFNAATATYTFGSSSAGVAVTVQWSYQFSLYYTSTTQAAQIPLNPPYQVSTDNQAYFFKDNGVVYVSSGAPDTSYSENSGVYTFSAADAGKYVYISYVYVSSDPNLTNSSSINITFFGGGQSQAPWSYMTSKYPGDAFGYSGMAYAGANPLALGLSASMPNYNFELLGLSIFGGGILDAHPCDAMRLILTDPLFGVNFPPQFIDAWTSCYAYWASNNYFVSKAINEQQSVTAVFSQIIDVGNVGAVWSNGTLKLIPYGDATTVGNGYTYTPNTTPVYTLTIDDLLPLTDHKIGERTSDDTIQVSLRAPQDCLNYMQVQWTNRLNDYNIELTPEQNDGFINQYGFRPEAPQTWDWITTQQAATWALNLRLKRSCYIRAKYRFALPYWFTLLEPMDMIVLPTGEPVRILSIELTPDNKNIIEAEQWTYGSNNVTIYPKQISRSYQPNTSQAIPGDTIPIFIQNTTVQSAGVTNLVEIGATGQNSNWGGCNVLISLDNVDFTSIGTINGPNVLGILTAELPIGSDPDNTDTLSVDISLTLVNNPAAELVSVSAQQNNNFVSLCAIVDPGAVSNELVSYQNASLTSQGRYNLSSLRRGVYATPIGDHKPGASFAFLGPNYQFLKYAYKPQFIGQGLFIKLQSFNLVGNQVQNLAQCKSWPLFITNQGSVAEKATALYPSTSTQSTAGGGTVTGTTAAYDKNFSTACQLYVPGNASPRSSATVTFSGFPSEVIGVTSALYATVSSALTPVPGGETFGFQFSLDGGVTFQSVTWTPSISQSGSTSIWSGTMIIPLAVGQQLSNVQLQATAQSPTPGNTCVLDIIEIWVQ